MAEPTDQLQVDAVETGRNSDDEGLGDDLYVKDFIIGTEHSYIMLRAQETDSLLSTLLRHLEIHGRTYHRFRAGENDYWAPNDETQNESLDIGHHMLTVLLGDKLYLAPIDPETVDRVLDVGCGTGIWCMDFADAHPQARVEGVDLSPTQPGMVPPNCHFVVDDVENEWLYPSRHFDFIHIRCLRGAVKDWVRLYRQAYQRLKPGGWIQHLDMSMSFTSDDGSVSQDHIMRRWSQKIIDCGEHIGKTFLVIHKAVAWLNEVGFEDVHQKWYKVPVGRWARGKTLKEIGQSNYDYCDTGAEGWTLRLLIDILEWPIESCQVFIAQFREALADRRNHAYYYVGVFWARRPMA